MGLLMLNNYLKYTSRQQWAQQCNLRHRLDELSEWLLFDQLWSNHSFIIMKRQSYEQEDHFYRLLDYLKKLFSRQNLCTNTYLYKQMHGSLTVPLFIIAEEKSVVSISRDYGLIIDALESTGLVQVVDGKQVRIIEHPTVKINVKCHQAFRQIEEILKQKDIKYEISKRYEEDQYVNLTVFSQNIQWLEGLIRSISKEVDFQVVSLMEDIKFGVDRISKLKVEHARKKTALGKTKYSLNHPPEIFVRKALDISSSEDQQPETAHKHTNGVKHANGETKNGKNIGSHPQKKYKSKVNKASLFQQDFPQLST